MPDSYVTLLTLLATLTGYRNSRWQPSFPVSMATILNFDSRPTSDNVESVISESGMVENMRVEVGIGTPSLTVEKLFSLPV